MADFRTAVLITLDPEHEGGFQKNPHDRANWTGGQVGVGTLVGTKYGITALDMPGVDIENLTEEQAITYYSNHYWKPFYSQINDQLVANKLFDMGVLFGISTAVKVLQTALDLEQESDGIFGPQTLQAVNTFSPRVLLNAFKQKLVEHATKIANANSNDAADLPDWVRRIAS